MPRMSIRSRKHGHPTHWDRRPERPVPRGRTAVVTPRDPAPVRRLTPGRSTASGRRLPLLALRRPPSPSVAAAGAGLVFGPDPPVGERAAGLTPGRWLLTESEHRPARDPDIQAHNDTPMPPSSVWGDLFRHFGGSSRRVNSGLGLLWTRQGGAARGGGQANRKITPWPVAVVRREMPATACHWAVGRCAGCCGWGWKVMPRPWQLFTAAS